MIRHFIHDPIPTILFLQKHKNLAYQQCFLSAKDAEPLQDDFSVTDSAGIFYYYYFVSQWAAQVCFNCYIFIYINSMDLKGCCGQNGKEVVTLSNISPVDWQKEAVS